MMLSEGHSWIQGQDGHVDQSFIRKRNKKGRLRLLSTCCVLGNTVGAFTRVTLAAEFSSHAVNERSSVFYTFVHFIYPYLPLVLRIPNSTVSRDALNDLTHL